MARLGGPDGRFDGLQVAHFADQDDVRVGPQHAPQGLREAGHVRPHLALVDDRFLVVVVILDRVFHRDDVPVEVHVDVVDHRGQRGGFARAGGPGDQEQAAGAADQVAADLGQPDLLEGQEFVGDLAAAHGDIAALAEDRDAEAGGVAVGEAEVGAPLLLEFLLVPLGRDRLHERDHVIGLQDLGLEVPQVAVEADGGLAPDRHMEVAGPQLHDGVEQAVDLDGGHRGYSRGRRNGL